MVSKKPKKQRFQKRLMNPVECLKTSSKSMAPPKKKKVIGFNDMEVTDVCGEECFSKLGGSRRQSGGS